MALRRARDRQYTEQRPRQGQGTRIRAMSELHVSAAHKMLVVPKSTAVGNMFPTAKVVSLKGKNYHLVPHKPAECFLLRTMGYNVPAPILTHYDWPGQYKAFDAQRQTSALLTMNKRAYVLNSMGTGKTSAALWAWDYLRGNGLAKKMLVVCPLSTMKFTWQREIFGTLPHRTSVVAHHSSREKRIAKLHEDADIIIVNHDGAKMLHDEIMKMIASGEIDTICIDELAVYRNGKSQRTKGMKVLAAKCNWVWGMTGSPMPRSPTDVWAQCQIITPSTVDKYFGHFRDRVMVRINQFKYAPKRDAVETAFGCMQPAVRFTMDDVVELPDVVHQTKDIPMGPIQAKIYKTMASACHAALGKHEITAANAGAVMMKLLQVATGYVYDKNRDVVTLDGNDRIRELVDIIDENDRKVLVFVPFIHALDGISSALTAEGIEHAVVSGST